MGIVINPVGGSSMKSYNILVMTLKDEMLLNQMKKVIKASNAYIQHIYPDHGTVIYKLHIANSSQYEDCEFFTVPDEQLMDSVSEERNIINNAIEMVYVLNQPLNAGRMQNLNSIYKKFRRL